MKRIDRPLNRILVFCLPGFGDTIMAIPALRAIRHRLPRAHITALTMFTSVETLCRQLPYLDETIQHDFVRSSAWQSLRFVWRLRKRGFDATVLVYPANRLEYNVVAFLVGAPVRIGHRYRAMDRRNAGWLNTHAVMEDDALSNVRENLRLARILTGHEDIDEHIDIPLPDAAKHRAQVWLDAQKLGDAPLIGIHAGGSTIKNHVHKRWSPEHFAALAKRLHGDFGARVLLVGGDEESQLKQRLKTDIGPSAVIVDELDVFAVGALMAHCAHVIANDSGLMHLASALGIETTGIFGPTNSHWVQMQGARREDVFLGVPCQPCFPYSPRPLHCRYGDYHCLRDLTVEHVYSVVAPRLRASLSRGPRRTVNT